MDPEDVPAVSVVVPTYSRSQRLMRCLESLRSQHMSSSAFEIIVVDDGSKDDTRQRVKEFREAGNDSIRYIKRPHAGPAAARNSGIRASAAQIVAFTDDDCIADRDWLIELVRPFDSDAVSGVEGRVVRDPECTPFTHFVENLNGSLYLTANIAYRRESLDAAQGFDEAFLHAASEDWDMAFRVMEGGGRIIYAPAAVVTHAPVPITGRYFIEKVKLRRYVARLYRRYPEHWVRTTGKTLRRSFLEEIFFGPFVETRKWRHYFRAYPSKLLAYFFWQTLASAYLSIEYVRVGFES